MTRTVGRYEVLGELGRGGMATVHLARQPELDRLVALKEMTFVGGDRESLVKRFVRESRLAGALSHPSIVTVFDYFEHDGTPYIAMEYVAEGALRPYLGGLSDAQRLFVLTSVLAGLMHAEEHGVVHRDLKPENLLVSTGGRVKITDFGVAKATRTYSTALTGVGMTVGTPGYMAPEQALAEPVGPWTDLYAVGCIAYELFVGRVPFADSDGPMAILMRHVSEPIPPANYANPHVDPAISNWIAALTARDPGRRVQTANAACESLEDIAITLLGPRWERDGRVQAGAERPAPEPRASAAPSVLFETFVPRPDARPEPEADIAVVTPPPVVEGPPVSRDAARVDHAALPSDAVQSAATRPPRERVAATAPEAPSPQTTARVPPIVLAAILVVVLVTVGVLVLVA